MRRTLIQKNTSFRSHNSIRTVQTPPTPPNHTKFSAFLHTHQSKLLSSPTPKNNFIEETFDFDSYISLLQQCRAKRSLSETRSVHLHMMKSGFPHLSLGNKLVDAYLKCESVDDARNVFDEMSQRHIVSWNSMISAYIRCRRSEEAIRLYKRMFSEGIFADEFTFSSVFKAFSDVGLLREGQKAHGQLVVLGLEASNVFVSSALVDMYAKLGKLGDAQIVSDRIIEKDVVLVTALIVGYTQNGEDCEALEIFSDMVKEGIKANEFTFASILIACGNLAELSKGKWIHGEIIKCGFETANTSQTSLLTMYSKCGSVDDSMKVFNHIVNPNLVTWTALITGLVINGREEPALSMLCEMMRNSVNPNAHTFSITLRACSSLAMFDQGKQIHAQITKTGLDKNMFAGAALIDMYSKCGTIEMARLIFDGLMEFDIVSVNSMIHGYAQNGYGCEAIRLFNQMKVLGLDPNDASFVGALSACSNTGLLEEGHRIFSYLLKNSDFKPSKDHYACMVDLLGRAGRLEEAEELITQVKNPDIVLWRTLLSACKIHGDVNIAKRAAEKVIELEPGDSGTLILLSNIYAQSGNWNEVIKMKTMMREMRLKKDPALSWVEVDREVHTFTAGDQTHPRAVEIYEELEGLIEKIKDMGYAPNTKLVLQDLDEMEKEKSLYYHSEKLAIVFGLLSSTNSTCIRIYKNVRVCGDCHAWIKLVSKVVGREIIARDAKRFHHFRDGVCSCGDYW